MMAAGQDKGLMLRLLLASSQDDYEAIVFVDDSPNNVINVDRAFDGKDTPGARAFWYTAFEEAGREFWASEPRLDGTIRDWRSISSALCEALGTFCGP